MSSVQRPIVLTNLNKLGNLFQVVRDYLSHMNGSAPHAIEDQLILSKASEALEYYLHHSPRNFGSLLALGTKMQNGSNALENSFLVQERANGNALAKALYLSGRQIETGTEALLLSNNQWYQNWIIDVTVGMIAQHISFVNNTENKYHQEILDGLSNLIVQHWRQLVPGHATLIPRGDY